MADKVENIYAGQRKKEINDGEGKTKIIGGERKKQNTYGGLRRKNNGRHRKKEINVRKKIIDGQRKKLWRTKKERNFRRTKSKMAKTEVIN